MKTLILSLGYGLTRLLALTYRFRPQGLENLRDSRQSGCGSYILAIWHQNLFAGILAQSGVRHTVMISRSRDGDPVALLCHKLGHLVIRGSSRRQGKDKGGQEAKDEMIEVLTSGLPGAITVDGPRGPAHEVKPGIIEMACKAQVPIIPYLAVAERYWVFPSWDRFRLPKPFAIIHVYYGVPYRVPENTPFEAFDAHQCALKARINELETEHLALDRGHPVTQRG